MGLELKIARMKAGMTQQDVADKLGVCLMTVSRYERDARQLTVPMAKRFAELYNVPWTSFYE